MGLEFEIIKRESGIPAIRDFLATKLNGVAIVLQNLSVLDPPQIKMG